jgi:hypothetical protein
MSHERRRPDETACASANQTLRRRPPVARRLDHLAAIPLTPRATCKQTARSESFTSSKITKEATMRLTIGPAPKGVGITSDHHQMPRQPPTGHPTQACDARSGWQATREIEPCCSSDVLTTPLPGLQVRPSLSALSADTQPPTQAQEPSLDDANVRLTEGTLLGGATPKGDYHRCCSSLSWATTCCWSSVARRGVTSPPVPLGAVDPKAFVSSLRQRQHPSAHRR